MEQDQIHTIQTSSYLSQVKTISENLLYFERHHNYQPPQTELDVFGNFWFLAFADVKPECVYYSRYNKKLPLQGQVGILIPPFSIIEWQIYTPELKWNAYIWPNSEPILKNQALEACYFVLPKNNNPKNLTDIRNIILNAKEKIPISKINLDSPIAKKIKNYLDSHLGSELSIQSVAKDLNISSFQVSRIFKKCYNLTPVVYRNKLRIFDSMAQLLFKQTGTVADTGFNVGFADLSRFNKEFVKYTSARPSQFQRKN